MNYSHIYPYIYILTYMCIHTYIHITHKMYMCVFLCLLFETGSLVILTGLELDM